MAIKSKNITGWILIGIIALLIIGVILISRLFKSEEKLKTVFKNKQNLSFLLAGYDSERNIEEAIVLFYQTGTDRVATVSILPDTLISYGKLESFKLRDAFKKKISNEDLMLAIGNLIGEKIDYYFFIKKENFIKLIDMIEGVEIFSEEIRIPEKNVHIPSGLILLDGDKAVEYLTLLENDELESAYKKLKRGANFVRSLLKLKQNWKENITPAILSNHIYNLFTTNMALNDILIIYNEIIKKYDAGVTDFSRGMINVILYCDKNITDKNEYVLLPKMSGNWVKSETKDALEKINKEFLTEEGEKVVIQILNGTDIAGFAERTKKYLMSFGFEVSEIGNADSENYENTIVIIQNSEEKATKLADLIKCKRIVKSTEISSKNIDATLIIGRDFNGRVVK
ncbi:MAG TPA: LCP family protein [Spirochaetota bacterium]|nr:LCP family protein [Spirochaetota bacterium]HOL57035.1 LCP family protein [Spirochaetota bacterium]HPP04635.1 LCP family protein [Spirochaetota bacterium]